ncbi:GerAB/ArcD/ProY family transporter [Paenibacillus cremeus]|uniref:GerAB/ArcD/ProY family transporter n=1 Tax=Paenibacillus cremeus TaxID=2163881 RepID=A0A559K0D9_9BACL|nr:GerAB/ArcD/ProY family transporter [Paenibacillus cremeus]TVY05591.1 GerAB/ArcD/ProY family transporter [Paenibacillus cremeus]
MNHRVQLVLLVCVMNGGFVYLLYPKILYSITVGGHWVVILYEGLLQMVFMLIYKKGLDYFPKKDVIEIFRQMGKWAAYIVLVPFAFVLTAMVGFGLRAHSEEIREIFLNRTPSWAVLVLLVFLAALAAVKGLETMMRACVVVFIIVNSLVLFIMFTIIINFDVHNASPVLPMSPNFLLNTKINYLAGFSPLLFLGFVPSENNMKYGQLFMVWSYVTLLILIMVYIPLFVFGQETVATFRFPVGAAVNSVDLRWFIFSQQSIFFGISLIGFTIFMNAVLLWMAGQLMQKTFNWQRTNCFYWIIAFAIIAFFMGVYVPNLDMVEKLAGLSLAAHALFIVFISFTVFIYSILVKRRMASYEKK